MVMSMLKLKSVIRYFYLTFVLTNVHFQSESNYAARAV